jgi:hypothetical protein
LVYIAAPYGPVGDHPEAEIRRNVARALALGRLAAVRGYAPIVPHAIGFMGTYGAPNEDDGGTSRLRAIESGEAHAASVGSCHGEFWLLLNDQGVPSSGCAQELAAWRASRSHGYATYDARLLIQATWDEWRLVFVTEDLTYLHDDPVSVFAFGLAGLQP